MEVGLGQLINRMDEQKKNDSEGSPWANESNRKCGAVSALGLGKAVAALGLPFRKSREDSAAHWMNRQGT